MLGHLPGGAGRGTKAGNAEDYPYTDCSHYGTKEGIVAAPQRMQEQSRNHRRTVYSRSGRLLLDVKVKSRYSKPECDVPCTPIRINIPQNKITDL